jgi:hypothetical protein
MENSQTPEVKITIEAGEQKSVEDNEEKRKKTYDNHNKRSTEEGRKEMLDWFHRGFTKKEIANTEGRKVKSVQAFIDSEVRNHFLLDSKEWNKLEALLDLCWEMTKVPQSLTLREFFDDEHTCRPELEISDAKEQWPNFIKNKRMMRDWIEYFQCKFDCQEALKNNIYNKPTEKYPAEKLSEEKKDELTNSKYMGIEYHNLLKMPNIFDIEKQLGVPLHSVDVMDIKKKKLEEFYKKNIKKD